MAAQHVTVATALLPALMPPALLPPEGGTNRKEVRGEVLVQRNTVAGYGAWHDWGILAAA
ncbi:hypothetical protein GCM10007382_22880 [Salinibacterium xinjiangense]|nr:hypothetical protein GCM10007382_22880 [Salinibacterium xinjiangense]